MSIQALEKIKEKVPDAVEEVHSQAGDDTVRVQRDSWFTVLEFLRKVLGFDLFVDLTAVDYLAREEGLPRFEVVVPATPRLPPFFSGAGRKGSPSTRSLTMSSWTVFAR